MCWVCKACGDGTRWYLNPKNFARQMYKVKKPGEVAKEYGEDPEAQVGRRLFEALDLRFTDPQKFQEAVKHFNDNKGKGLLQIVQILPLKEALQVAEMAYPIAGLHCICRYFFRATEETNINEYTCTGLGPGLFKWERWPERYKGGVNFMTPLEAKEWLIKLDKKGFCHLIMTFGGSYVGGICNCDYPVCGSMRFRLDYGIEEQCLKGHHVAKVDYEACNGCGVCVQRCKFGAIKFEVTSNKTNIDQFRCFGCGVCETGCPRGAIELIERESLPALREVW